MKEFLILFKHELKMFFPFFTKKRKKHDLIMWLISIIFTIALATVCIIFLSKIVNSYVDARLDKEFNPIARSAEILNVMYCFIIFVMTILTVQKMHNTITSQKDKEIYLRLPVKQQNLFLSKMATLLIWNYILGLFLIVPVNIIFYLAVKPTFTFFIKTIAVYLLMPIISFFFASIILVPYLKLLEFLKNKYTLIFIILSFILICSFLIYSKFLNILQQLIQTGSIKFLFNNSFILKMKRIFLFTFPANCFSNIMVGKKTFLSFLIVFLFVVLAGLVVYFISKKLYYITLYKNNNTNKNFKYSNRFTQNNTMISLLKKEFISVYRDPKYLFSYFTIAVSMPAFVYCCYTLFNSLIINAFGMEMAFSLALSVLLVFSILTNTFCASNISREGLSFLNLKTYPVKQSKILFSKVLFCAIVSSVSIIISSLVLIGATGLTIFDGIICCLVVTLFSFAQILISTRIDLNHAQISESVQEREKVNGKTITKVVLIGLVVALAMGLLSIIIFIYSKTKMTKYVKLLRVGFAFSYIFPIIIAIIYFIFAVFYYRHKLEKSFNNLVS